MKFKELAGSKAVLWAVLWAVLGLLLAAGLLAGLQGSRPEGGMSQEEQRIAQVLGAIEGAGKVKVALFYAKTVSSLGAMENGAPTGAVVVAQGADRLAVRLSLIRAVRTLLSLPEAAVDVFVMEPGR